MDETAANEAFTIVVNGEETAVPAGTDLASFLARLGRDPRTVAVEHNGRIVARDAYGDEKLAPGDRLEVVQFVQGG